MRLQTFTISEEVLSLLEFAVGFEIKDNKDMDYALELLCNSVMPKKPKKYNSRTRGTCAKAENNV